MSGQRTLDLSGSGHKRHTLLPEDFAGRAVSAADHVLAFCGDCPFFEVHALGGGGECHKGHDCTARAAEGACVDRRETVRSKGPLFDLSE